MTDLYAFTANRSLRRAEPVGDSVMATEWEETGGLSASHLVRFPWRGQELLPALREITTWENAAAQAVQLAEEYLQSATAVTLETLRGGVDPAATLPAADDITPGDPIPGQVGLAFIDRLDRWLVSQDNQVEPDDLDEWLRTMVERLVGELTPDPVPSELPADPPVEPAEPPVEQPLALEDRGTLHLLLGQTWSRLLDSLAAALLRPREGELAQRLNRLLLVAGLVERRSRYRRPLSSAEVYALLARRTVLMPDPPFPEVLPPDQVQLVRQATTSDLFVVRREWRGYVADEVADIRNVLPHEDSGIRSLRIDESELLETTSERQDSSSETSSEFADESSFEEQTKRELDLDIHAEAQVGVSATYSSVKIDASAGFSADFSLEDSTDRATQIAKRAIARAASKIETEKREERSRRTLSRTEVRQRHGLKNETDEPVRGVYRWVKRVDRFQVWRYPDRFQLEFQIPEPGRYLLDQLKELPGRPGAVPEPPAFELPAEGITADNYLGLAATYHATGLPEPPQDTVGVSVAIKLPGKEPATPPAGGYVPPLVLSEEKEVPLTPGYAATKVRVKLEASPAHGTYAYESEKVQWLPLEAYHTITASVAIGNQLSFDTRVGTDATNKTAIQATGTSTSMVQFLDAHLHASSGELDLNTPVTVKLPVVVTLVGALVGTVAIEVQCTLTDQARDAWVQDVFDGLQGAYDAWLREWRTQQAMAGTSTTLAERSPARHEQLVRAEIRRHVVAWLLGEQPFAGRNAVGADEPDIDVTEALRVAPNIQFLEQCLEWSNLTWVAYPYYWADRVRWPELMDLETADPALGEFLRSGSIRVVVPARPRFSGAVMHWLTYRQPWLGGGCAPLPGQPLYVSVAREIQDQLVPPADGTPGESWEVALPTTLQWLDEAVLPRNELGRLGKPPNEPLDPLLPDDEPE